MFVPEDCTVELTLPFNDEPVEQIVGNRERSVMVALTHSSLYIYLANPFLLLHTFRRNQEEVEEKGKFQKLFWKHNGESITVTTDKLHLYIYTIAISPDQECFNLNDDGSEDFKRMSSTLYFKGRRPVVDVKLTVLAKLESRAACVTPFKEEIFVCLEDGWVHRISWTGEMLSDLSFHIRQVPFSIDQVTTKIDRLTDTAVFVKEFVYCPLIGGICMVLSNGRAALLIGSDQRFLKDTLQAIWVPGDNVIRCCATNHKFRLIYFGHQNGDISAYQMEENGSLVQVFGQKLFVKNGTQLLEQVGSVRKIECLSQGGAVSVIWNKKDITSNVNCPPILAIFSPCGAQWWTSLEDVNVGNYSKESYTSSEWGIEGYHLWLALEKSIYVMHLVHAMPDSTDRAIMMGNDKVHISPRKSHEEHATAPQFVWQTYTVPHDYIAANWPLRIVGLDPDYNKLLVAVGHRGFCFYNFKTNKWRLFRKEAQERSLFVTGGVTVFENFILVSAYDTNLETENIYIFNHEDQLDLDLADKMRTSRVLFMSSRQNHLITFDVQCAISIYGMQTQHDQDRERLSLQKIAEIRITDLLIHPTCVVSIQLTSLNYFKEAAEFGFGLDALLVNISGHLLLLSALNKPHPSSNENNHFQLHPPMLIASNVERFWVQSAQSDIPHLNKALWINAGIRKLKVWLPAEEQVPAHSSQSFISSRIMLPVDTNTYPLAIDDDCLASSIESLSLLLTSSHANPNASVHSISRTSEVFMHRLLKQLLKRNLGKYALQIVSACRSLSYFEHILELLLHDVLEEEATSSEPIPEPLLPRVVSFVREFPEYLKVITYCARKTEMAIRNHLFTVSHQPRELFRMCLKEEQLETATSCLIVLQSMETAIASVEYATTLLDEALTKRQWKIARDIVRFLQSIDKKDLEDVPESPLQKLVARPQNKQMFLPADDSEDYGLVYNSEPKKSITSTTPPSSAKPSLVNQNSFGNSASSQIQITSPRLILSRSGSISQGSGTPAIPPPISPVSQMPEQISNQVNVILNHHAVAMLDNFNIRDLGAFTAHLSYNLLQFFKSTPTAFKGTVDQFPLVLMKLHAQFNWPYPVATELIVSKGVISPSPSSATISLIEECSSISSEDVLTSPSFVMTPGSNMADRHVRRLTTDFNRKVFEKLCENSKAKGTKQSEDEINHIMSFLVEAKQLEWMLFLSILKQDYNDLSRVLSASAKNLNKLGAFRKLARIGLAKLVEWAETTCSAYVPVIDFFREYVETSTDPHQLNRVMDFESTRSSMDALSISTNGDRH